MTAEDEKDFQKAEKCWICDRKYKAENTEEEKERIANEPVRDHCHITGKYRGSAHRKCNLKLQISAEKIKIPVIFHNLKGYDSHLIIEKLGEKIKKTDVLIKEQVERTNNYFNYNRDNSLRQHTLKKIHEKK